ncbi:MAG TPA: hypothetical protein VJU83_02435 [Burkholderiales bacterium]|nr:hypothetical protein [Burkholderiales bacterium]
MVARIFRRSLISGSAASLLSMAVAALIAKRESGDSDGALNAVSHIAWGGPPEQQAARPGLNTFVGAALHHGASVFWALLFEGVFGERARKDVASATAGAALSATAAYVVDYHVVPRRFQPGFEARMSRSSMFFVYAALGAGFLLASQIKKA